MNSNTREALTQFIEQVERLAEGVVHMTGTDGCVELIRAAEILKGQLATDETII